MDITVKGLAWNYGTRGETLIGGWSSSGRANEAEEEDRKESHGDEVVVVGDESDQGLFVEILWQHHQR